MKRKRLKRKTPLKRSKIPLRVSGKSSISVLKRQIQTLLRQIAIERDGGCIFRVVLEGCSGPLQAEHLISRSNSKTFADTRNIVCLCKYHHIFWKQQNQRLYWELIEQHLGKQGWEWLKKCEQDRTPYKVDWKLEKLALEKELKKYEVDRTNKQ